MAVWPHKFWPHLS
jgi:hypothetical protein